MEYPSDCLFHLPAISVLDSADIEVTDSRLPNATFVDHRPQVPFCPLKECHLFLDWKCMNTCVFTPASPVRDLGYRYRTSPSDPE